MVLLLLLPIGKTVRNVDVKLHPCLPEGNFKMSRLIPSQSNVRKQWHTGNTEIEGELIHA